jgi:hypothetical protein
MDHSPLPLEGKLMATGFDLCTTEELVIVRDNLLRGLDRVAESLDDGTFEAAREKGSAPPAQGGQITLGLLRAVEAEISSRTA